jgi:hypothetical protein
MEVWVGVGVYLRGDRIIALRADISINLSSDLGSTLRCSALWGL